MEQIQNIRQGEMFFEGNAIILNYKDFQQVIITMSALAQKAIQDATEKIANICTGKRRMGERHGTGTPLSRRILPLHRLPPRPKGLPSRQSGERAEGQSARNLMLRAPQTRRSSEEVGER